MKRCLNIFIVTTVGLVLIAGCKKFVEVTTPRTGINSGNVYSNDFSAISVMTAVYAKIPSNYDGTADISALSLLGELLSDNLSMVSLNNETLAAYYQNNLVAREVGYNYPPSFWMWFYNYIYNCNAVLQGAGESTTLTPAVKKQLMGEAYFFRAFCYFYLVNLYGDVPLPLTTNYKKNEILPRVSKKQVYQQIIADLKLAQQSLQDNYMDVTLLKATSERTRPNKGAATALLARTYLYNQSYDSAAIEATKLIDNDSKYKLVTLGEVFKKNSQETIWSLQPIGYQENTWEARRFILPDSGPDGGAYVVTLSSQLISSFENNDQRLKIWTANVTTNNNKYFYSTKYTAGFSTASLVEYEMVLRLAELYLVRAECNIKLGNVEAGINDLNILRERANDKSLPDDQQLKSLPTDLDETAALLAVDHERQAELFTEWGHRWFDLKRRNRIDEIMNVVCPLKGGVWEPYKALFPIPQREIDFDYSLEGQQNPGYN